MIVRWFLRCLSRGSRAGGVLNGVLTVVERRGGFITCLCILSRGSRSSRFLLRHGEAGEEILHDFVIIRLLLGVLELRDFVRVGRRPHCHGRSCWRWRHVRVPTLSVELNGKGGIKRAVRVLFVMMRPYRVCRIEILRGRRAIADMFGSLGAVGLEKQI